MSTATATKQRASGIPGLVIVGNAPFYQIVHAATGLAVHRSYFNTFRRVREAKDAAARCAAVAPWERDDFLDWFRALSLTEQAQLGQDTAHALQGCWS